MHAKTDSEGTSLAPSSPTRSPRRTVYYVQSPSRDSHDGEKTTNNSFHSTPIISPMGSPPHSGNHSSRESSSSRFSESLKHHHGGSRKILPNDPHEKKIKKKKKGFEVIDEEGLLDDEDERDTLPRKCYYLAFVLGFFVLFSFFSLVLWGAGNSQKPRITMKTIKFNNFVIQAGTDTTGVPTDMATLNSTVRFTFRNTASFFGVHVTSTPLSLTYSDQLTLAAGRMNYFYQRRKSQRSMTVVVEGNKIPLYGGGSSLSSSSSSDKTIEREELVPLMLRFKVRSRAYVLGKLVKHKFYINVLCNVKLNPNKLNTPIRLKNSCTFN